MITENISGFHTVENSLKIPQKVKQNDLLPTILQTDWKNCCRIGSSRPMCRKPITDIGWWKKANLYCKVQSKEFSFCLIPRLPEKSGVKVIDINWG